VSERKEGPKELYAKIVTARRKRQKTQFLQDLDKQTTIRRVRERDTKEKLPTLTIQDNKIHAQRQKETKKQDKIDARWTHARGTEREREREREREGSPYRGS